MSTYSLQGYQLAVSLRSAKTILVEGAKDKRVVARLMLEKQLSNGSRSSYVIDEVGIISGDDIRLSGKGCKEKVMLVASMLKPLAEKVNWLVDREWDEIDLQDLPATIYAQVDSDWGLRTKGHSIENYWFDPQALCDYLKVFHGAHLPPQFFTDLGTRFQSILKLATAYSLAAKSLSVITKCTGAISAQHIVWDGLRYLVSPALNTVLATRSVSADLATLIAQELERDDIQRLSLSALQWLCHGHLGEELIRACAASLAANHGCSQAVVDGIERGLKLEQVAHHADWLARRSEHQVEPLDRLIAWAI